MSTTVQERPPANRTTSRAPVPAAGGNGGGGGRDNVAARIKTVQSVLTGKAMLEQLKAALPRHITPDRMARLALTTLRRDPKLALCNIESFYGAVMQCAQLGLEPGILGQCWILPYKGEAQLIVGYRGYIALAWRSDQIQTIQVHAVFGGEKPDQFRYTYGLNPTLTHIPEPANAHDPATITHVYCVIRTKGDGVLFDVMTKLEVDRIRAMSPAVKAGKRDTPWFQHYEEMAKKTVIRRLMKMAPMSVELARAAHLDELADNGESQGLAGMMGGPAVDVDFTISGDGESGTLEDVIGSATTAEGFEHPIEREGEEPIETGAVPTAVDDEPEAEPEPADPEPSAVGGVPSVWAGVPDSLIRSIKNRAGSRPRPEATEAEIIGRLRSQYGADLRALSKDARQLKSALALIKDMVLDT